MFSTDATQTPLNSRGDGGGVVTFCAEPTCDCPHAVSKPASTKSERDRPQSWFLRIAKQCKSDATETAPRHPASPCPRLQAADTRGTARLRFVLVVNGGDGGRRLASS